MGVIELLLSLILFVSAFAIAIEDVEDCGVQKQTHQRSARLVGADIVEHDDYPWMAALHYIHNSTGRNAGINCAGFVISKKFVVTAASCLYLKYLDLDKVWLGVRRITEADGEDVDKVRKFAIVEKIPHEQYNPISNIHDIALLKIAGEIKYSDYIRPLCLPNTDAALPESGTMLKVAGWGKIRSDGPASGITLAVDIPIYSHEVCERYLHYEIRSDQICAEGEHQKGTCWGDGGGPLMQALPSGIDSKWHAIGVISSVIGCGKHGRPMVHTRVSSYANWIKIVVNK